jgi:hypothetical protein
MTRAIWMLALLGCGGAMEAQAPVGYNMDAKGDDAGYGGAPAKNKRAFADEEMEEARPSAVSAGVLGYMEADEDLTEVAKGAAAPPPSSPADDAAAQVRRWFPQAFLWQPEVHTDATGRASVDVTVPDTLTTWRVLGLAHDRGGRQSGTVHTFRGAMTTWLEVNVPPWLTEGDRLVLPIQAMHQGADPLTSDLVVSAGTSDRAVRSLTLAPGDRRVQAFELSSADRGSLRVTAALGSHDALERRIPVRAAGEPRILRRGGLLGADARVALSPEPAALPGAEVDVWVHGGALSLLAAELERLGDGDLPWEGAYGQALARRATELADKAGVTLDPAAMRRLELRAWQRVRADAASVDALGAAHLLRGLGTDDTPVVAELRDRLVRVITQDQRGDGTWGMTGASTLPAILVQTAAIGGALPSSAEASRQRAMGALERLAGEVDEPFTAAVIAASGLVSDSRRAELVALVSDAVVVHEDGRASMPLESGARSVWWTVPSQLEALGWAGLALAGEDDPAHAAIVATLLASYDASSGFGAGPANPLLLEVVSDALPPPTQDVRVRLEVDGETRAEASVTRGQPLVPALLHAEIPEDARSVRVVADPPTPGLAWTLQHTARVPWGAPDLPDGITVDIGTPSLRVGRVAEVPVTIAAPSGTEVSLALGLPPGVTFEGVELGSGTATEDLGDHVRIDTRRFGTGDVLEVRLKVRPSFAGTFRTAPHRVGYDDPTHVFAPSVWTVRE